MRVSGNELLRACQRAFEGLGLPAGIDTDAADMVTRLELLGLPGARMACAQFEDLRARDGEQPSLAYDQGVPVLDAHGRSALLVGRAALDLAYARAVDLRAAATVRVVAIREPLLMVGAAVDYGAPDHCFHLQWKTRGARYDFVTDASGRGNLFGDATLWNQPHSTPAEACTLTVMCGPGGSADDLDKSWRGVGLPSISSESFARREHAALTHGLEIPDDAWAPLAEAARAVLVPASDASRALGAGAGQTDND